MLRVGQRRAVPSKKALQFLSQKHPSLWSPSQTWEEEKIEREGKIRRERGWVGGDKIKAFQPAGRRNVCFFFLNTSNFSNQLKIIKCIKKAGMQFSRAQLLNNSSSAAPISLINPEVWSRSSSSVIPYTPICFCFPTLLDSFMCIFLTIISTPFPLNKSIFEAVPAF